MAKVSQTKTRIITRNFVLILFVFFVTLQVQAQCPGASCTYTIIGTDNSSYTVNTGETICLEASADFTGTINLANGTLLNCATATQSFTLNSQSGSTNSTVNNYGYLNFLGNYNLTNSLIFNNYESFNVGGNLNIIGTSTLNNYGTTDVDAELQLQDSLFNFGILNVSTSLITSSSGSLSNSGVINANNWTTSGSWNNSGFINIIFSAVNNSSSSGTIDGGCFSCNNWTNRGTINGVSCGNINIANSSEQTSLGSLSGDLAIIDATPPGAAPFIDTNNGTVGPNVVWNSCTSCTPVEICNNGIDDDGDGYIDADDPDCITQGTCGCPPGGTIYPTIAYGHTVPLGAIHCLTGDVTLSGAWNNIILNGSLYILNDAHLDINGGKSFGANANLIICEGSAYTHEETSNNYSNNIYNYGWLQICGTGTTIDTIIAGENSLTALKGGGLTVEQLRYAGNPGGNAYFMMDVATNLNGSSGNVCLPGGTTEMIVEVDAGSITPTCVTDCNGCPELSSITTNCDDGSVEAAYLALQASGPEICFNAIDDNGDGRIDEPFPGGVQSDMQLWLKAEIGTNTIINGDPVDAWADQSVNGYSANADINSTDDPLYNINAINFNPGIEFDGTYTDDFSDGLHLGSDYIYSTDAGMHIFVVLQPNNPATGQYDMVYNFGGTVGDGVGFSWNSSVLRHYTPTGAGGVSSFTSHSTGAVPSLLEYEIEFTNAQTMYLNGTILDTDLIPGLTQLTSAEIATSDHYGTAPNSDDLAGPVSIGRKSASQYVDADRIFNGVISEVLVYSDTLSSFEKEQINSYLAIKYGITMNQNYYSSSSSLKKDISDGYANAIAGIGRDDCSGLHQKQSKSVSNDAIVTIGKNTIAATNSQNAGSVGSDGTYLIWGNDGVAVNTTWNNTNVDILGSNYSRIDRVWSFTETFDVTNISLQVEVDHPSFNLPAMPVSADGIYYLLQDDDGDFTNGGTTSTPMSLVSGDSWEVTIADPTSGYFSFGVNEVCAAVAPVLSK